jgi:hypothetical protein
LRHNCSPPRHFRARRAHRLRARNGGVHTERVCLSPPPARPRSARRERLRNWLALLALLAIGIV